MIGDIISDNKLKKVLDLGDIFWLAPAGTANRMRGDEAWWITDTNIVSKHRNTQVISRQI